MLAAPSQREAGVGRPTTASDVCLAYRHSLGMLTQLSTSEAARCIVLLKPRYFQS